MNLEEKTEEELVKISNENDNLGLVVEELFTRYKKGLERFIYQKTKNREETEDILQETFLKVFKSLNRYKYLNSASIQTWINSIALNTTRDYFRKKKIKPKISETDSEWYLDKVKQIALNPEEQAIFDEEKEILKREIDNFPPEIGETFRLRCHGLYYREISQNLEIPVGTAKSRVFKARKILEKRLIEDYDISLY